MNHDNEVGRPRRVKLVASVTATLGLLSGALLFAEHDASARTLPRAAALVTPALALPTAAPATAQQLLPADASSAQVLALGAQIAAQGVAGVQAVTAGQTVTPLISSIVCPVLLADRAQVVTSFAALIAQFPAQTAALIVQRNAALAIIDAQLAIFGCPVPSGSL